MLGMPMLTNDIDTVTGVSFTKEREEIYQAIGNRIKLLEKEFCTSLSEIQSMSVALGYLVDEVAMLKKEIKVLNDDK